MASTGLTAREQPMSRETGTMLLSVSVVIPAQNEAAHLAEVLSDVRRDLPGVSEIIVVDDGSHDETAAVAEELGATVVRHQAPLGYGAAIKSGLRALADRDGFPLVDLGSAFQARVQADGPTAFSYPCDGHWNARGHAEAAAAIRDFLTAQHWI